MPEPSPNKDRTQAPRFFDADDVYVEIDCPNWLPYMNIEAPRRSVKLQSDVEIDGDAP